MLSVHDNLLDTLETTLLHLNLDSEEHLYMSFAYQELINAYLDYSYKTMEMR